MSPAPTPDRDGGEPWKTASMPGGTRPSRPSLREGGFQHSFPRRGREGGTRTNHLALKFSVSVLTQLHFPKYTHTPWASTARSFTPRLQESQAAAPALCYHSPSAARRPAQLPQLLWSKNPLKGVLSCPAQKRVTSEVSNARAQVSLP